MEEITKLYPIVEDVVVMEDKLDDRRAIRRSLMNLGFRVLLVTDGDGVVRIASRRKRRIYILDIDMGPGRKQEGLDTLERIKNIDENIFVGIITNFANLHRAYAKRLGVNIFQEKSPHIEIDTCVVVKSLLEYQEKQIKCEENALDKLLYEQTNRSSRNEIMHESDNNIITYQGFRTNDTWLKEHIGKYVAFVEGNFIAEDVDREKLLEHVRKKYSNKMIFLRQVEEREEIIDIPSPLFTEN